MSVNTYRELPVSVGDYVYYLYGNSKIVLEKRKVIGFDFRDGRTRIVMDFGDHQVSVLADMLGIRLFRSEGDARKELEKWTNNN